MVTLDEVLAALVEHLCDLRVDNAETGVEVTVDDATTYAELGILSADPGVVLRLSDGRSVALKLTDYPDHRYHREGG